MTRHIASYRNTESREEDDEPPSLSSLVKTKTGDEPPGTIPCSSREKLFRHIETGEWNNWKWQFRHRITTVEALKQYLPLTSQEESQLNLVVRKYPLSITPHYLSLIDPDDSNDPIRKQAVPSFDEILYADMGEEDPLEEERDSVVPGLVHRYPDRVLMVLTDVCPMLCRHCTRKREWRHGSWMRSDIEIRSMLDYIKVHTEVRDVVLSGGDVLTMSTQQLEKVIAELRSIPHVEIIRIGTRFPVVLPQRIDKELCDMLSHYGPIWLNTHFNHHREVTPESAAACDRLLRAGVPVNNQSVLLRGVNDSVEEQSKLVHALLKIKVRPYYLYQCDEVQGTEHLRTPVETGIRIIEGLRGHTSGLGVPTFVIDLPGGGGKVPVQPDYVLKRNERELVLRNYKNQTFRFRNPAANGRQKTNGRKPVPEIMMPEMVPVKVRVKKSANGAKNENRISI